MQVGEGRGGRVGGGGGRLAAVVAVVVSRVVAGGSANRGRRDELGLFGLMGFDVPSASVVWLYAWVCSLVGCLLA